MPRRGLAAAPDLAAAFGAWPVTPLPQPHNCAMLAAGVHHPTKVPLTGPSVPAASVSM